MRNRWRYMGGVQRGSTPLLIPDLGTRRKSPLPLGEDSRYSLNVSRRADLEVTGDEKIFLPPPGIETWFLGVKPVTQPLY
jgi:hypothetical protein